MKKTISVFLILIFLLPIKIRANTYFKAGFNIVKIVYLPYVLPVFFIIGVGTFKKLLDDNSSTSTNYDNLTKFNIDF